MNVTWFTDIYDEKIPRVFASTFLEEFSNYRPNDILYWEIFNHYKKRSYRKFDLGGWQICPKGNLPRVNNFKENFGEVVYFYKNYSFFRALGRKLIRNSSIFWKLNRKIKHRGSKKFC